MISCHSSSLIPSAYSREKTKAEISMDKVFSSKISSTNHEVRSGGDAKSSVQSIVGENEAMLGIEILWMREHDVMKIISSNPQQPQLQPVDINALQNKASFTIGNC